MSDSSQKKKLKLSIELTPKEQQICDLLKDVVKKRNLNTTMRVAGGWVRDKLLGLNSDDIDIALDNMMGKEFAEHVNEHMKQLGHKTGSIGVIKLNPEQSKHLETATVNLFEVWVDFVNLRSESYEADSRIPDKISFGTPSQDAHRRDITINSLFYNINEDNIEDFTEKGIVDLQDGIIRTPLDPIVTFSDDPLRCLRVIRFAGRFNFEIENATYRALSSDVSRNGIKSKISRERIGKEVDKMLKDLNGSIAVYHLHQTDLFDVVFQPHPSTTPLENASIEGTKTSRCAYWAMVTKASGLEIDQEEKRLMFFSTAMVSYRSATFVDKKQKVSSQPSYMVLESLKLPVKDAKAVTAILESVEEFKALAQNVSGYTRKQLGLAIKKPAENWKISLMVALSHEVSPLLENIDPKEQVQISDDAAAAAICKRYQNLVENVTTLQLLDCWNDKPLLNGKEISSLLSLQAGPSLGKYIHDLLEWQLEFPAATVEEAKTWLLEHKNKQGSTSN